MAALLCAAGRAPAQVAVSAEALVDAARRLRRAGEAERAQRILDAVLRVTRADEVVVRGTALRLLGSLRLDAGDVDAALSLYRQAEDLHDAGDDPAARVATRISLAGALREAGDAVEAMETYRLAITGARATVPRALRLERLALLGLAAVVCRLGDDRWATRLADQAAATCADADRGCHDQVDAYRAPFEALAGHGERARELVSRLRARGDLDESTRRQLDATEAASWLRDGEPARALATLDAYQASRGAGQLLDELHLLRAEAHLALGQLDGAAEALEAGRLAIAGGGHRRARLDPLRARLALARGDVDGSRTFFERYAAWLSAERAGLSQRARRHYYTRPRVEDLEALLALYVRADDGARAVDLVERFKSRALSERLLAARHAEADPLDDPTYRDALTRLPSLAPDEEPVPPLPGRFLPADWALLDVYLLPDEVALLWITSAGLQVRRRPVRRAEIESWVAALESADPASANTDVAIARLSDALVAPVRDLMVGVEVLGVLPHGATHRVAFGALELDGQPLLRRVDLFHPPSIQALRTQLTTPARGPGDRLLAVADPSLELTEALLEVLDIAPAFAEASVLTGRAATDSAVLDQLPEADVVHFAVHARSDAPGTWSWLALAEDELGDGRLTPQEVTRLALPAKPLVSLMACASSFARADAADELDGLDRAFLAAGARTVIATRAPVSDAAARFVTRHFYEGLLAGRPAVSALADAQRALARDAEVHGCSPTRSGGTCAVRGVRPCRGSTNASEAWSFVLIGDPR